MPSDKPTAELRIVMQCQARSYGSFDLPTCGCDFAVLTLSPELLAELQQYATTLAAARASHPRAHKLAVFTDHLDVYRWDDLDERVTADLPEDDWDVLPDHADLADLPTQPTSYELIQVMASADAHETACFRWEFQPRHADVVVETTKLYLADLLEALSQVGVIA